jgi:hypothetical protein
MKSFFGYFLLAFLFASLFSCKGNKIPEPENLIERDQFVKMLTDMYIVQGINLDAIPTDSLKKKITQTSLYYSVLKKYNTEDTVFVRSLIYYSSFPKVYEKMHTEIMNTLSQSDNEFKPMNALQTKPE